MSDVILNTIIEAYFIDILLIQPVTEKNWDSVGTNDFFSIANESVWEHV